MRNQTGLFSLVSLLVQLSAYSESVNGPSVLQQIYIKRHNAKVASGVLPVDELRADFEAVRPYAEYEKARYLLMDGHFGFESEGAKKGMVRYLPKDVTAVIVVKNQSSAETVRAEFGPYIESSRLIMVIAPKGGGFWVRDSLPVPVFGKNGQLGLVDARYFHGIEPDKDVAGYFNIPLLKHQYFYEGGNFASDRNGNCMAVNERISSISDSIFRKYYGCKTMRRLRPSGGIGHVDERAKFLSDKVVVTDEKSFVSEFKKDGYEVHLLPKTGRYYETYVNSLLVNGVIYMPEYQHEADSEARAIYEGLGFTVHPFDSRSLSNSGLGSLHCITMTYPDL